MVAALRALRVALAALQALHAARVPLVHAIARGVPVREREFPFVAAFGK